MDARQSDMRVAVEVGGGSVTVDGSFSCHVGGGASQLKTHQCRPMWWVDRLQFEGVELKCGARQIRLERSSSWRGRIQGLNCVVSGGDGMFLSRSRPMRRLVLILQSQGTLRSLQDSQSDESEGDHIHAQLRNSAPPTDGVRRVFLRESKETVKVLVMRTRRV